MTDRPELLTLTWRGPVIEWRGPAPYYFVVVEEAEADLVADVAREVSYGWGCLPVEVRLGATAWTTSLMPRDGLYVVPLKAAVRRAEGVGLGDDVSVTITLRAP